MAFTCQAVQLPECPKQNRVGRITCVSLWCKLIAPLKWLLVSKTNERKPQGIILLWWMPTHNWICTERSPHILHSSVINLPTRGLHFEAHMSYIQAPSGSYWCRWYISRCKVNPVITQSHQKHLRTSSKPWPATKINPNATTRKTTMISDHYHENYDKNRSISPSPEFMVHNVR